MLSIRSKRNATKHAKKNTNASTKDVQIKQEELINGSLELIDFLYQYITADGVGLSYVKTSLDAAKGREDLFHDLNNFFMNIELTIANLTVTSAKLNDLIFSEAEQNNVISSSIQEYLKHNDAIDTSLKNMNQLLLKSKALENSSSPELSLLLEQLAKEVAEMEDKEAKKVNLVNQIFIEYQHKMNEVTSSIELLLGQMKQEITLLKSKDELEDSFTTAKTINTENLNMLDKRQHDNIIMLNDLISFVLQLKSILTCLKEECCHS